MHTLSKSHNRAVEGARMLLYWKGLLSDEDRKGQGTYILRIEDFFNEFGSRVNIGYLHGHQLNGG
jgi:hypothetical protein